MQKLDIIFMILVLMCAGAHAQTPPRLTVFVDSTPIIIDAPAPFVEVSRILPAAFEQRSRALPARNRLLAWFIPAQALRNQLNDGDNTTRYRSLQIQVLNTLESVRHNVQSFKTLRDETLADNTIPQLAEDDVETLFNILDLKQFTKNAAVQKILGHAEPGENSFTLCIAAGAEGGDQLGGREIETSITCATYALLREKILLLTVTGPELSARELRNSMRLTREWITLLHRIQKPEEKTFDSGIPRRGSALF
jgi:hypothetical protein